MSPTVEIRAATDADDDAVLGLLRASMGWVPDEQHARFFRWKHRENPHGRSPAWVAVDGDRIVGLRTFMRWRFWQDGRAVNAARAVDTATHPDHQGEGIFSRLTEHALRALGEDGIELVFNTPNQRSLPGYLKLGWQKVGRLPVVSRPRNAASLARTVRARTPAERWSIPCEAGLPAAEALADGAVTRMLDRMPERDARGSRLPEPHPPRLRTARTAGHLAWRYRFPPLHYRVMPDSDGLEAGLAVFRLRRRGPAVEAAVCETLVPEGGRPARRRLLGRIVSETGADHAVLVDAAGAATGALPVPGLGPVLVCRPLGTAAPPTTLAGWDLTLGDVELF